MNEDELKRQYLSWLENIVLRRIAYLSAKKYLKEAEKELKVRKSIFNKTYINWKKAREKAEKSKRKWKTYPYKLRQWSQNNFGKVMDLIEKQEKKQ